jgi:hypothetical protein
MGMPAEPAGDGQQDAGTAPDADASAGTPGVDDLDPSAALAAAVAAGATEGETPEQTIARLTADVAKWKANSRKNEGRAKENLTAAQQLKEIQDAQKTDLERANERAAASDARAAALERRNWISDAATAYDIPAKFRDRITGTTEEEIETSAQELAGAINELRTAGDSATGSTARTPQRRPVQTLRPGAQPALVPETSDPNSMLRNMIATKRGY